MCIGEIAWSLNIPVNMVQNILQRILYCFSLKITVGQQFCPANLPVTQTFVLELLWNMCCFLVSSCCWKSWSDYWTFLKKVAWQLKQISLLVFLQLLASGQLKIDFSHPMRHHFVMVDGLSTKSSTTVNALKVIFQLRTDTVMHILYQFLTDTEYASLYQFLTENCGVHDTFLTESVVRMIHWTVHLV